MVEAISILENILMTFFFIYPYWASKSLAKDQFKKQPYNDDKTPYIIT